jgi:hypothetical protein
MLSQGRGDRNVEGMEGKAWHCGC